jgi:hypothetical protein
MAKNHTSGSPKQDTEQMSGVIHLKMNEKSSDDEFENF